MEEATAMVVEIIEDLILTMEAQVMVVALIVGPQEGLEGLMSPQTEEASWEDLLAATKDQVQDPTRDQTAGLVK